MIVKDEAHIVTEALASVSPLVDYWVIVDTGSTDDTPAVIEGYFAAREIPGELHQRPWQDFGHNRSEALDLAQGKGDYIWVIDADDVLVGTLDLSDLTHATYLLRYGRDFSYWRMQIFRSGLRWRYRGVVHETPYCEDAQGPPDAARIEGDYYVDSRRLGGRSRAADRYLRDAQLLQRELEAQPDDARTVFYLAQSYCDAGDHAQALRYYEQRAKMGGYEEEVFYSLLRQGAILAARGDAWPAAQEAYLAAYQQRPQRAEPFYALATHYRSAGQYALGYHFAKAASEIPLPAADMLFVDAAAHAWKIADERAICAHYVGQHRESFALCQRLLAGSALPEAERARVESNRDFAVPYLQAETAEYPAALVEQLRRPAGGERTPQITLTITSCKRLALFEKTVNSFLRCCEDLERIERWICVDDGSSAADRERMRTRYPFFEFIFKDPADKGHAQSMNIILDQLDSPYWLHLEDDWHFFAPQRYVSDALRILEHDAQLGQVLFNRNYGETLQCRTIAGGAIRHTAQHGLRYREHEHVPADSPAYAAYMARFAPGSVSAAYWPHYSLRPSLLRMAAIRAIGRYRPAAEHFELEFARRYHDHGYRSAFFDGICCVHSGKRTFEPADAAPLNAYALNDEPQFAQPTKRPIARRYRVQLLADWSSSAALCELWQRQSKGDGVWEEIAITAEERDVDYYALINRPQQQAPDPARTIVFQMEPRVGVAGWGAWAAPDRRRFLQVRSHDRYRNNGEWHLGNTWAELSYQPVEKTRTLSSVTSSRTVDPGQRLRVDFLKHLEQRAVEIDIFGRSNEAGFSRYRGALPPHDKRDGILPYRYTFAAENHAEHNYVTEKFFDALLGECLCFYWGCPNLEEHFDPAVFIRLPLEDLEASRRIVQQAIRDDEWSRRIAAIRREKRRFLDEGQFFPTLARVIRGHVYSQALAIRVLNLDRRPDRWARFCADARARAGELAARCERFAAVDGRKLTLTPELQHIFRGNDHHFRRGIVGCALSHLALWRAVAAAPHPWLILEDDATLSADFNGQLLEICGQLHDLGDGFDVALLGYHPWTAAQRAEQLAEDRSARLEPMAWARYMGGTFGYVVSSGGARKLLALVERDGIQNGIDWFVMRHAAELRVLHALPNVIFSPLAIPRENGDSDVEHDFEPVPAASDPSAG